MKFLLPLMILATLVSCDGYEGKTIPKDESQNQLKKPEEQVSKDTQEQQKKKKPSTAQLEKIAKDLTKKIKENTKRGMVTEEILTGTRHVIKGITENDLDIQKETINRKKVSTVLMVEGSLVYSLVEQVHESGVEERTVVLKDLSSHQELLKALEDAKAKLVKGKIQYKYEDEAKSNFEGEAQILSRVSIESVLNPGAPCESTSQETDIEVVAHHGEATLKLSNESRSSASACKMMENAELMQLDLSSVNFCDERGQQDCEKDQDMTYLISDL